MDHQQSHGYVMQPPPPPQAPPVVVDPYQRPSPPPPVQHGHPWPYPTPPFQYQVQHSPSPPPPQWLPPQSHSSDHAQYLHPPPPPPYPGHQPPYPAHHHYPQSHSLPPRTPHAPQSYAQDLGNGSWSHHQGWDYPNQPNSNEQDWAEKARAWAVAKAAADNQYPVPVGRPEEQNYFHDQYPQSINPQFQSVHVPIEQASSYQQYQVGMGPSNRTGPGQLQESQYITSGQSSYTVDMHVPYTARDGNLMGNSSEPTHPQENSSISPLPYQQEVPSSYSSVSGNEGAEDRYEQLNISSSMHAASMPHNHAQPQPPAGGWSGWAEEHHHLLSSKQDEPVTGISDQPLNFSHHFNPNLDQHMQSNYTHPSGGPVRGLDPTASISSNYAWTPSSASGFVHPPMPPTISSGAQVDHPVALASPASGHSAPTFPTGHGFQPPAPLIGASFGAVSHPTTSFFVDAYGVSERPKKASVPNWLREEIIKNKAAITSSVPMLHQEDLPSTKGDMSDKFSQKLDHSDSKSMDSSRSAEDEDEDEDVEAARNAAINQEIKRVLTEVLLKVTDELFDEIATKVLNENSLSVEVVQNPDMSNHRILPSTPTISTPTASAKVLISATTMKINSVDGSEKSTSGSAGDVLGLGSYASDEEDDEIQISGKLNSKESSTIQQSSSNKVLEDAPFIKNGGSTKETEERGNLVTNLDNMGTETPMISMDDVSAEDMDLKDYRAVRELLSSDTLQSSKKTSCDDEMQRGSDASVPNKSITEKAVERPDGNLDARKLSDDSRVQTTGNSSDKNDIHANKRNSVEKDHKECEYAKEMGDKKGDENRRRHARTEREHNNGSKDRGKEKGRISEKAKDPEVRKRPSHSEGKEGKSETRGDKRRSSKESSDEKRHDKTRDEKRERSRHKNGSDASRHKRHRSSSVGSRDSRKDNFITSRSNDSSDESSDASKRRSRYSKRHTSPSPPRSRKRQVLQSPHSKHSKRRHSHYSSLENTRGGRSTSRSRSPVRRR